jgi:hypothetical protein
MKIVKAALSIQQGRPKAGPQRAMTIAGFDQKSSRSTFREVIVENRSYAAVTRVSYIKQTVRKLAFGLKTGRIERIFAVARLLIAQNAQKLLRIWSRQKCARVFARSARYLQQT